MKYYEGLIEWESNGLQDIPTQLLEEYINALMAELKTRKQALRIHDVVGQSEQLVCECKDEWIKHIDNFSDRMQCEKCGKSF